MPDEIQTADLTAPEQTAGEVALDLASNPEVDPWDAIIEKAGISDDETPEAGDAADAAAGDGADDQNDDDAGDTDAGIGDDDGALSAGITALAQMPGMTADRAKRLLKADPDLVREYGREAMARAEQAPEAKPDAPEKPAEAPAPDTTLAEILGQTLDKEEAAVVIKALEHQKATLMAEFKKLVPDLSGISKQLESYDSAVSELYGRRVVDGLSEDFPELKERGAYEKVHAKALEMRKAGVAAPVGQLIEMAVIALHGGKVRAEAREHKQKIARAKAAGKPSTPGVGEPADRRSQFDKDFDRVWDKALKR